MGNANNWHHHLPKHFVNPENRFGAGEIKNWEILSLFASAEMIMSNCSQLEAAFQVLN